VCAALRALFLVAALLPAVTFGATPSEGVELDVRRGFFTETDVGAFFTLGGDQQYSNAETYLQLGVGYDINDLFEISANFGIGASAADCFGGRKVPGDTTTDCVFADNFTVAFLDVNVAYLWKVSSKIPRFYIVPKLAAGYTSLDPAPVSGGTSAANVGAGIAVEYATYMDHFAIGIEVMYRIILGPNISSMSIFPRVKYTF
jgi:hypothetical protein